MNEKQRIHYEDRFLPPIREGRYKLAWDQSVTVSDLSSGKDLAFDHACAEQEFLIGCERFRVQPKDIHSFYPPDHAEGEFENHIPQITFMNESLPWQRSAAGEGNPWFVLLLFDETDRIEVRSMKLKEAFWDRQGASDGDYVPDLKPLYGESGEEACVVLDVPWETFKALMPKAGELPYLAHIRQVSVEDKATHLYRTAGRFSSLIGTRMPAAGKEKIRTQAHLVSLEGYDGYWNWEPKRGFVRMISLTSWEFSCAAAKETGFLKLAGNLDCGFLHYPPPEKKEEPKTAGSEEKRWIEQMDAMLSIGYLPLAHDTREGQRTVSWYKSPLVPYLPENSDYSCLQQADAALAYLTELSMLDTSYAAAWQLGRLLSLRSASFLGALYELRRRNYELDSYRRSRAYISELLREKENSEQLEEERVYENVAGKCIGLFEAIFAEEKEKWNKLEQQLRKPE